MTWLTLEQALGNPCRPRSSGQKKPETQVQKMVRELLEKYPNRDSISLPDRHELIGSSFNRKLKRDKTIESLYEEIDRKANNNETTIQDKRGNNKVIASRTENIGLYGSNSTIATRKLQRDQSVTELLGGLI